MDTAKSTREVAEDGLDLLLDLPRLSCRMPKAGAVDEDVALAIDLDRDKCRNNGSLGTGRSASRGLGGIRVVFGGLPSSSLCPSRRSSPVINFTRLVFPAPARPMTRMILTLSSSSLSYYRL